MFIVEYTWQHRYDFTAIIECPHCGHQQKLDHGYDDHNYHYNVLPRIGCEHCGKSADGTIHPSSTFGKPKARLQKVTGDSAIYALEEAAQLADGMYYLGPDFATLAQQIRDLKVKYK